MAKLGRGLLARVRPGGRNAAGYRRFATAEEDRRLRRELAAAVVALLAFLAAIGWALTL